MHLAAFAALAVANTVPAARAPSDAELESAVLQAQRTPDFADRVEQLSRLFLGVPYGAFPLGEGEGVEPQPRWRADQVDCQTYVETVLALANARSLPEAKTLLDDIRYRAPPLTFSSRNHFTEAQWVPANEAKGYLKEETTRLDPHAPVARLVLHRAQWSKVPGLARLVPAQIPEGAFPIRYLPLAEARRLAPRIAPGSVLLIVRAKDPERVVRVSHMALVVKTPAGLMVRHASFGAEKQVIEEKAADFLDRQATYKKWPVIGIALLQARDASARRSKLK